MKQRRFSITEQEGLVARLALAYMIEEFKSSKDPYCKWLVDEAYKLYDKLYKYSWWK